MLSYNKIYINYKVFILFCFSSIVLIYNNSRLFKWKGTKHLTIVNESHWQQVLPKINERWLNLASKISLAG